MSILDDVSEGLSGHFDELRISRRAVGGRVYALEHPLNHQELAELRKQLDIACAKFGLVSEHRLAWIVFATECGYEYSGLEYWPKLERYISSWQFGDRERLRKFFESFAKEFDGAATSGAWARQFSVIAWPITHAILPRDLQVHLSQALYLARHYLLGLEDFSNVYVGEVIAEHAPAYGDRFQRFIRQHEFVGAIAKQLLYASNTVEMFGERTFHRIVSDLEKHAEARYWLREACSHVKPKVKVALGPQSTKTREPQSNERLPTSLAPALAMRKDDSGSWALYLYPPSLINYLQQQPTLKPSASATRFSILGGAARQMFRVRDLICANPRERRLQNFPSSGTPLIVCDPADSSLARLLQEESVLLPRETWVFRISRDGTAWLQMSPTVSPGNKYLLANDATKTELPGEEQCAPYSGVRLTRFEVPTVLTDRDAEHLDQFGLSVNRTTTVSSWGLQPRRWNSGESAEFVEGEAIFLRIERDHSFDLLRCTLDSEEAMEYTWQGDGECIIELCGLSVGGHSIRIDTCQKIQSRGCTTMQTLSTFCLCFDVRPPSTWQPYQIPYEAIVIEISPDVPTLEEVLGNQIAVVVQGQASDPVDVELVLADEVDEYRHLVCHRRLPILKEEWRSKLETALQHEDIALHALAADRGYLLVRSERFGTHRVSLSVFPKPVRWKISSVSALGLQLCLYCEGLEEPTVQHYSFDAPARPQQIPFQELSGGITCANGLFVATMDGEEASIAVSSVPRTVRGLDELRVVVETPDVSSDSIDELARAYQQWAKAFAAGRHIHIRRQQIMDAIQERIVGQIAGVDWVKYEHCSHKKDAWELLEDHVSPSNRNYGITLGKRRGLIRESELREAFRSASVDYRITNDAALIQAAWAIAFDPSQLPSGWSPPTGGELQSLVTLVRGARLMKLGHVASAS